MRKIRARVTITRATLIKPDGSTVVFETTDSKPAPILAGFMLAHPGSSVGELTTTREWYTLNPEDVIKYGTLEAATNE